MRSTETEIARFETVGADGTTYFVVELQRFAFKLSDAGKFVKTIGVKRHALSDGRDVDRLTNDRFQICDTGEILVRKTQASS
jgi:hypothetical protein